MRKLLALLPLLALFGSPARAGEMKYLGAIVSTGTSVSNVSTAAPFVIPPNAKLTLYCDAGGRLLTDSRSVATSGATKGLPVGASTYFPTSVGNQVVSQISSVTTALIAWISNSGTATCDVWVRTGNE